MGTIPVDSSHVQITNSLGMKLQNVVTNSTVVFRA